MNRALLLLATLFSIAAVGQNKIEGRVIDEQTGEPIPFANVFFANTTFGASTSVSGEYSFSGFPSGKYDLTVTFVGYTTAQQSVIFEGTHLIVNQKLAPETKVLKEILVKPDTIGWKRNYRDFKYHFLGTSKYAQQCKILNPKDLSLFFDPKDGTLVAYAKQPIVVENMATGYRIKYYLYHFEYASRSGLFNIYGLPQFEEMTAKNERERKHRQKERQRIYEGSLLHFMRAWRNQAWRENDFKVSRLFRVPNKERPSDEYLSARINELRKKQMSDGQIRINFSSSTKDFKGDSLSYYLRLRNLPKEKDSVVNEKLTGTEFMSNQTGEAKYQGLLAVQYDRLEDPIYAQTVARREQRVKQRSILHVLAPLKIYSNGYYEDVRGVFLENYWSWSEKISTLLPLDYEPVKQD
jgi:CarboxypepD_reg-like domain